MKVKKKKKIVIHVYSLPNDIFFHLEYSHSNVKFESIFHFDLTKSLRFTD